MATLNINGKTYDVTMDDFTVDNSRGGEAPADTTPPSAPGGTAALGVSSDRVDVSWNASSDDIAVTGYRIYRDGTLLNAVDGSVTRYSDTTVSPSTAYTYTVRAVDGAGNLSDPSVPASVTTADPALFRDGFETSDTARDGDGGNP